MVTILFLFGLLIGSFLNVVIHRLPRGESLLLPGSRCITCGRSLRAWELVPIVSYLAQLGRCRGCGENISWRYPLNELATGVLFALIYSAIGFTLAGLGAAIFACLLVVVAWIDVDYHIIPDLITFPGLIIGLLLAFLQGWSMAANSLWGMGLLGGLLLLVAVLSQGGMGGGDIKLAAVMGAFLGWKLGLIALLLSFLAGSLAGLGSILFLGKTRKDAIPFGPFLALGGLVSLLLGESILHMYLRLLIP